MGIDHVPYISAIKGNELPIDRMSMLNFLIRFADTQAGINAQGKAEGIVVRTFSRSMIRKIALWITKELLRVKIGYCRQCFTAQGNS